MVERVIIIGLDGAGSFQNRRISPNIVKFLESGIYCNTALAQFPTNSGENWGSILTGVVPKKHGITNDTINSPYSERSIYPTLFKLIHEAFPSDQLASLVSWGPINVGLIEPSLPVVKQQLPDDKLVSFITNSFLPEHGQKTKFLFIHLDNIDHAGHTYGYGSIQYNTQYKKTDTQVQTILKAIDTAGLESSTLVVLTADHGGLGMNHGGSSFAEKHVLWGMRGPGIFKKELTGDAVAAVDIGPTILNALGIQVPKNFDGKIVPIFL